MGRRSKSELFNLTERIILMSTEEKLTIVQIAEVLQKEGYTLSREAVRRSLKSSKDLALELKKFREEAKVMLDSARDTPDTDVLEATLNRVTGLLYTESKEIDEIKAKNPLALINSLGQIANAKAKIAKLRLDFNQGFAAAKRAVVDALKTELADHPDLQERLTMIVAGLAVEE